MIEFLENIGIKNPGLIALLSAFFSALALSPFILPIYKKITKKKHLNLKLNDPVFGNSHLTRYSTRSVELLGRDQELKKLQNFIKSSKTFCWIQIAGVAGQGKSRLGYELVLWARDEGWEAGFVEDSDLEKFSSNLLEWKPNKPHLLVFDYVVGRESLIKSAFKSIFERVQKFSTSIRILFLERQRWDQGGIESTRQSNNLDLVPSLENRAEWFLNLTDRYDGNDKDIQSSCFEDGIVELKELELKNLIFIVRQIGELINKKILFADADIEKWLKKIDSAGRPLYAYFLGQALIEGINPDSPSSSGQTWGRNDLLDYSLHREQGTRWNKVLNTPLFEFGNSTSAEKIAVVATIAGGIDFTKSTQQSIVGKFDSSVLRQAILLVNGKTGNHSFNRFSIIPSLQPDLLGEWFVLKCLKEGLIKEETLDTAWKLNPLKTSAFLSRISQDFLDLAITKEIIGHTPPDEASKNALQTVASEISVSIFRARHPFPKIIVEALFNAAESGELRAINNLGFFLCEGIGVERNYAKALDLYYIGASNGDGRSMANIGLCFKMGRGVAQDFFTSLEWYRKGADAGNGWAMSSIGTCYQEGRGTAQNFELAVQWFQKGADAGDGQAMCNLGVCYHEGIGVDQNFEESMNWYHKGASVGDSQAMACLGAIYEQGLGVEVDIEKAVFWHRRGADFRNAWAMSNLGSCYKRGIGVEKDLKKSVEWFRSGANAGSTKAMDRLGYCYQHGEGVSKDLTQAVFWYRKSAELGEILSINNLGACYRLGLGVEKNLTTALRWYCKGVLLSDQLSIRNFHRVLRSHWKAKIGIWSKKVYHVKI